MKEINMPLLILCVWSFNKMFKSQISTHRLPVSWVSYYRRHLTVLPNTDVCSLNDVFRKVCDSVFFEPVPIWGHLCYFHVGMTSWLAHRRVLKLLIGTPNGGESDPPHFFSSHPLLCWFRGHRGVIQRGNFQPNLIHSEDSGNSPTSGHGFPR